MNLLIPPKTFYFLPKLQVMSNKFCTIALLIVKKRTNVVEITIFLEGWCNVALLCGSFNPIIGTNLNWRENYMIIGQAYQTTEWGGFHKSKQPAI